MDLLTRARNKWGEDILTHVSWDLLWASLFAGFAQYLEHHDPDRWTVRGREII